MHFSYRVHHYLSGGWTCSSVCLSICLSRTSSCIKNKRCKKNNVGVKIFFSRQK